MPLPPRHDHGAIMVFPSAAAIAPLLRQCAEIGLAPVDMWLLTEDGSAALTADTFADRLWSGGRFGLIAAAVGAAGGLLVAAILLAIPGIGAPVQQYGPLALLAVAFGGAVSMMPVWLPFGAIIEERKVEGYRDRFRQHLRDGASFLLVQADEETIRRLLAVGGASALTLCRFRGTLPASRAEVPSGTGSGLEAHLPS